MAYSIIRRALPRPETRTVAVRVVRRDELFHCAFVISNVRSTGKGHCALGSLRTMSTVERSRTRLMSRRADASAGRLGGRTTNTSTPSSKSAAHSAHAPRGRGTNNTRRKSMPRSTIATTPGSSTPTTAHQCSLALRPLNKLSARVRPPVPGAASTQTVLPRRSPCSGRICSHEGSTGILRLEAAATGRTLAAREAGNSGRF